MKRNMSNIDRIARVVLAAVFAYLYFGGIVTGTLGIVLVVLGGVFLLTAVVAFCAIYSVFNPIKSSKAATSGWKMAASKPFPPNLSKM